MEKPDLKDILVDLDPDEETDVIIEYLGELDKRIAAIPYREGKTGKDGKDGKDGKNGLDGIDGRNGKDGKDGRDGRAGTEGEKGSKGDDGTSVELKDVIGAMMPSVLARMPRGGGGMNRNIWVGGNSSVLSRYGDINLKAGSNVTLTYSNNDTTKTTDIVIASSGGGGGSVTGIIRSINTVSTSQTAGSTAGTDYVYICSAGIQLTLPDAVGNTNLYTVKNTSTSSVLVSTTASETIDAQSNLILATQYTSVDLVSDSANWDIT